MIGTVVSDPVRVYCGKEVSNEYVIRFDKSVYQTTIAKLSTDTTLVSGDVCLEESWFEPYYHDSIKHGEVYTTFSGDSVVKLVMTYDEKFLLAGIDGDMNRLYSDSERSYDDMLRYINQSYPIKIS